MQNVFPPGSGIEAYPRVVTGNDPGAGSEATVRVPSGVWWELISFRVPFVTSAVAGNRHVRLAFTDGNTEFARIATATAQGATLTFVYDFLAGIGRDNSDAQDCINTSMMSGVQLCPGWTVGTNTNTMDAGDNYGAPVLYVIEYVQRGERSQVEYELAALLRRIALEDEIGIGGTEA